jgi:hypothetical protein
LGCLSLSQQSPDWRLLEYLGPNTALEQRVVELSVGYFVADFVHFILFEPDFLMFFHHVFRSGSKQGNAEKIRSSHATSDIGSSQSCMLFLFSSLCAAQHPDDEFRRAGRSWLHMRHGRFGAR